MAINVGGQDRHPRRGSGNRRGKSGYIRATAAERLKQKLERFQRILHDLVAIFFYYAIGTLFYFYGPEEFTFTQHKPRVLDILDGE